MSENDENDVNLDPNALYTRCLSCVNKERLFPSSQNNSDPPPIFIGSRPCNYEFNVHSPGFANGTTSATRRKDKNDVNDDVDCDHDVDDDESTTL